MTSTLNPWEQREQKEQLRIRANTLVKGFERFLERTLDGTFDARSKKLNGIEAMPDATFSCVGFEGRSNTDIHAWVNLPGFTDSGLLIEYKAKYPGRWFASYGFKSLAQLETFAELGYMD